MISLAELIFVIQIQVTNQSIFSLKEKQTKSLNWVNTPVIAEALSRYQEDRLPPSIRLWLIEILELERN